MSQQVEFKTIININLNKMYPINPLLSILIATKNRIPFCISAIKSILSFSELDFELIIQDNSDSNELSCYIANNIKDKRLIYNYTPPPYSSIDNFNAVMSLAKGEYVCLIGDDDGINPEIFDVVRWAKINKIDSIYPKVYASYIWPNTLSQYQSGHLSINKFTSHVFSINPKNKLHLLLKNGIVNYMDFQLPKVYHGIVKRDCFEEIFSLTGHYFGGLSPDIYSAVALASIVKKHYIIDYPLTISGVCNASTTIDNIKGAHAGKLEKAPHFRDRNEYVWDENIPRFYSVQTIWAESAIKAIKELNIEIDLRDFNLPKMVAMSLLYNNILRLIFIETNKLTLRNNYLVVFYIKVLIYISRELLDKIVKKAIHKFSLPYLFRISNIEDIEKATAMMAIKLKEKNVITILKYLK